MKLFYFRLIQNFLCLGSGTMLEHFLIEIIAYIIPTNSRKKNKIRPRAVFLLTIFIFTVIFCLGLNELDDKTKIQRKV